MAPESDDNESVIDMGPENENFVVDNSVITADSENQDFDGADDMSVSSADFPVAWPPNSSTDSNALVSPVPIDELKIVETGDKLSMRRNHQAFSITTKNQAIDAGAKVLASTATLPVYGHLNLSHAGVERIGSRLMVGWPIKNDLRANVALDYLKDALVTSWCSSRIKDNITKYSINWKNRQYFFGASTIEFSSVSRRFAGWNNYCKQLVRVPSEEEWRGIMEDCHDSLVGGHEGITNTYKRFHENSFWTHMKADAQNTSSIVETASSRN